MKIIAITNNKGGVGKTTTAESIGAYLATQGHRTLLVDGDAQGNLTYALNVGMTQEHNLGEFLLTTTAKSAKYAFTPVGGNLWLLPSHDKMDQYQLQLGEVRESEYRLRDRLRALKGEQFDYVIIDCPPSMIDSMTFNAFCAADLYVIPAEPEPFAVRGLAKVTAIGERVRETINPGLKFGGFIFTRFNPKLRGATRLEMLNQVRAQYGEDSVLGHVPQDAQLATAQGFRETIYSFDPDSRGAKAYATIANLVLARLN